MKGNINEEYLIEVRKILGSWIKQMREDKKLSQQQLADKMGISRSTISKIEDGKWNFGIDTLTIFALHLDFFQFLVPKDSNDELAVTMRNRWNRANDAN
jgi:transcriptional regulator with XRE-family HTH domain